MRQFDVFVFDDTPDFDSWTPLFEDPALGWFHTKNLNSKLDELEAEWIVFAHRSIKVDRDFLNELAQVTEGFPMADAFAPRVKIGNKFEGGYLFDGNNGYWQISENSKMRFVAAPNPLIAVFSRRIIQRTGLFDTELPLELQLADYAARMFHAGGKMFSVPYLVAEHESAHKPDAQEPTFNYKLKKVEKSIWDIFYMCLPPTYLISLTLHHPSVLSKWFQNKKVLQVKRTKATDLSKLTEKFLKEITVSKAERKG